MSSTPYLDSLKLAATQRTRRATEAILGMRGRPVHEPKPTGMALVAAAMRPPEAASLSSPAASQTAVAEVSVPSEASLLQPDDADYAVPPVIPEPDDDDTELASRFYPGQWMPYGSREGLDVGGATGFRRTPDIEDPYDAEDRFGTDDARCETMSLVPFDPWG